MSGVWRGVRPGDGGRVVLFLPCADGAGDGQVRRGGPRGGRSVEPAAPEHFEQVVVRVVPPDQNEVDPAVTEQILSSFYPPLSLELYGGSDGQQMFVRGGRLAVEHAVAQLQAGYGQVAFEEVERGEDPVLGGEGFVVSACCRLRREEYYPLRTWREFGDPGSLGVGLLQGGNRPGAADPIRVLIGALDGLREGERALVQLVLVRRAPDGWADRYQIMTQGDFRLRATAFTAQMRGLLLAGGVVLAFLNTVFACRAAAALLQYGSGGDLSGVWPLAVLTALSGAAVYKGVGWWRRLSAPFSVNPDVVRRKVRCPAFDVQLRFWVWGGEEERARWILDRLVRAYSVFELAEGNSLVRGGSVPVSPVRLVDSDVPLMRLNVAEIAGMWHMPVGSPPERMGRQMFFCRVPQAVTEPSEGAVCLGTSTKGGDPVHLPRAAVAGGVFIIGKPQVGKSTLMEALAEAAMQDPDRAVVVIDPHQDMVRRLMGLVPPSRLDDVRCLDLAEEDRFPGINLLDMSTGATMDKAVSDLIVVGRALWSEYWGPRMEQALRYAALTLALINRRRVADGRPDEQLSVLFIPRLLLANPRRSMAYLLSNLPPAGEPTVDDVLWWWRNYYEQLRVGLRQEVISPVVTKIHHISGIEALRCIFGQPLTTVSFREAIRNAGIVLVNTGGAMLGQDVGAFVGALVLNHLDAVLREQAGLPRDERTPITVVVDEFQSLGSAVSWRDFMGQLRKFGAQVVLGTQSLAGMREINPYLPGEVLGTVMTVVAFQTSAEDAEYLRDEFDGRVPPESMVNLSPFHAYVKTVGEGRQRLPPFEVRLREPPGVDPTMAGLVRQRTAGYARPKMEVERDLRRMDGEPIDDYDPARAQEVALRVRAAEEQAVGAEDLRAAARAMGVRSRRTYGSRSGSVGRGLKARVGRRPGAFGGYQVE